MQRNRHLESLLSITSIPIVTPAAPTFVPHEAP